MEQIMVQAGVNPICLLFVCFILEAETAEAKQNVPEHMQLIEQSMGCLSAKFFDQKPSWLL